MQVPWQKLFATALLTLAISVAPAETVYKRVHPNGTVEYSDAPLPGGQAVEVAPLPAVPALPPPQTPAPPQASESAPATSESRNAYSGLHVVQPAQNATVFFDGSGMTVQVAVGPALKPGHRVVITMDGKAVAKGTGTSFVIQDVARGTHTLAAEIQDDSGKSLVRAPAVTFHFIQHSALTR